MAASPSDIVRPSDLTSARQATGSGRPEISDGTVNLAGASPTSQIQYTFAGHGAEIWHVQFTHNGFQYLEGQASSQEADVGHLPATDLGG